MVAQVAAHLTPGTGIERSEWFVEQQHLWVGGQRTGQCHSLRLPTRQRSGFAVGIGREVHPIEPVGSHAARRVLGHTSGAQAEGHVLEHAHLLEQQVVLEHHPHTPPLGVQEAARRRFVEHLGVHGDTPAIERHQPGDRPQRGALPCPIGAE